MKNKTFSVTKKAPSKKPYVGRKIGYNEEKYNNILEVIKSLNSRMPILI
jgi:hypothetical protein